MHTRIAPTGEREVWVPMRRKWLVLTPEEEVRRRVVAHLVAHLGVPPTHIVEEYPVELNGQHQRADIVVVGPDLKPWLVVECKAPEVPLTRAVLDQVGRYNSVIGAPQVVVTNGLEVEAYSLTPQGYVAATFPL